jgi:hypothetical protein
VSRFASIGLSLVAALSVSACGVTPEEACKEHARVECQKMWSCGSMLKIGTDEASCVQSYDFLCKAMQDGSCPNGKKVDVSKSLACTTDLENASCDQYKDQSYREPNCAAMCQ